MPSSFLNHVGPFMLVLFRMSGLLIFAPLLSSSILPLRMRALLCVSFTLAIYPTLVARGVPVVDTDLFSLVPLAFGETLIGLAMGLMASLPLYAVQLGGLVMGQQAGMSLGQIYNPALDVESDTIGEFLQYAALVIFVLMGGLEALFVALGHTFSNVPIGQAMAAGDALSPVELMTRLISSGFELALRVSAPVLCIILVETLASALVAKTVPQLNVQSIGFSIKVVITMLVLATSATAVLHAAGEDVSHTVSAVIQWTENLRPLAPS